ncbi:MAG: hypothetical protein ABA06_01040 [Parcubacteria bacterium C7867-001]|nr:MAG: hypothetical protein ABA06_01040 [Parcubacteria bacterium C7867-001]
MPAKKSWDVKREPVKEVRRTRGNPARPATRTTRATARASAKSLKARRSSARNAVFGVTACAVLLIVGGCVFLLWRPEVRIREVTANSEHASSIQMLAKQKLGGTYANIIPKNSVFFYPEHALRAAILDAYPDIAAVSLARSGFTALSVKVIPRVAAFWWCGIPSAAAAEDTTCYEADAEGLVFAPVVEGDVLATSTAISTLRIYGDLATASTSSEYPLRAHMQHVESIPSALRFVRIMNQLQVPVVSLGLHDDEADLITPTGTRITYVLGHEESATALAQAAFPTLNLLDGSIEYVDLRFPGKVYLKRRSE